MTTFDIIYVKDRRLILKYNLYIDRRTDTNEVIYVGIGNDNRVNWLPRNKKHRILSKTIGITREVLFKTDDYNWLKIQEILGIRYFNTFNDLNPKGCNFTKGGEGGVGKRPWNYMGVPLCPDCGTKVSTHRVQRCRRCATNLMKRGSNGRFN